MKRVLVELGCSPDKVVVNHLGVDLSTAEFKLRKREGPVKFFIASSFREKKGIPDALEAIGILKDRLPPFVLTIAGAVASSAESIREHEKMQAVIRKYDLAGRVRFVGFLSRAALLAEGVANDIFISTSKTARNGDSEGGTNIAVIEMAATGMPIVTTRHCDLPSTMGELNQRWLANEGDVDSIANAIEGIVADDWAALGASNRAHVEARYDLRVCVNGLEAIYENVEKRYRSSDGN
jgi:colanic acid/amylovoran biosynthesis glycosyltransferase